MPYAGLDANGMPIDENGMRYFPGLGQINPNAGNQSFQQQGFAGVSGQPPVTPSSSNPAARPGTVPTLPQQGGMQPPRLMDVPGLHNNGYTLPSSQPSGGKEINPATGQAWGYDQAIDQYGNVRPGWDVTGFQRPPGSPPLNYGNNNPAGRSPGIPNLAQQGQTLGQPPVSAPAPNNTANQGDISNIVYNQTNSPQAKTSNGTARAANYTGSNSDPDGIYTQPDPGFNGTTTTGQSPYGSAGQIPGTGRYRPVPRESDPRRPQGEDRAVHGGGTSADRWLSGIGQDQMQVGDPSTWNFGSGPRDPGTLINRDLITYDPQYGWVTPRSNIRGTFDREGFFGRNNHELWTLAAMAAGGVAAGELGGAGLADAGTGAYDMGQFAASDMGGIGSAAGSGVGTFGTGSTLGGLQGVEVPPPIDTIPSPNYTPVGPDYAPPTAPTGGTPPPTTTGAYDAGQFHPSDMGGGPDVNVPGSIDPITGQPTNTMVNPPEITAPGGGNGLFNQAIRTGAGQIPRLLSGGGNNNPAGRSGEGGFNLGDLITGGIGAYQNNREVQWQQNMFNQLMNRGDYMDPGQRKELVRQLMESYTDPDKFLAPYKAGDDRDMENLRRQENARGFNMSGNELGDLTQLQSELRQKHLMDIRKDIRGSADLGHPAEMAGQGMRGLGSLAAVRANRNNAAGQLANKLIGGKTVGDWIKGLMNGTISKDDLPPDFEEEIFSSSGDESDGLNMDNPFNPASRFTDDEEGWGELYNLFG